MKILWINDNPNFSGGAERYIYDLTSSLDTYEHYLLYKFDTNLDIEFSKPFKGCFPLVELQDQVKNIQPDLIYIHNISDEKIQSLVNEMDVKSIRFIHDHKLFCPREHKYTLLSNKVCTKKVGVGCLSCLFYNHKTKKLVSPKQIYKWQDGLAGNSKLIVASMYMKEQLIEYGHKADSIFVKNLYSRFSNIDSQRSKSNEPKENEYFLYIGSMLKGKGFDLLLQAFEGISHPFSLKVLTNNADVAKLGSDKNVRYYVNANDAEIKDFIKGASAVVIPSIAPETFSLVGVESLSLGTNVITSAVGGMQEWTHVDGVTLFKNGNVSDLAKVLSLHRPSVVKFDQAISLKSYVKSFDEEVIKETA